MTDLEPVVYLVDDDAAVLRGVARLLAVSGFRTRTFDCPHRFLQEHDPDTPGCAVLDLQMPGITGLQLQHRLAAMRTPGHPPRTRPIIFLTGRADVPSTVQAMKGGAVDFLTKPVQSAPLLEAIRRAIAHDAEERRRERDDAAALEGFAALTPREREVLFLVASGKLNKEIAAELGTAEKTIKVHRARVMEKMGAGSLAELVRLADRVQSQPHDRAGDGTKVQ